ncbi:rust resistance kinase Lr10-like [Malus sylvestris]|uniref:rust resistance kinase Lr10-like n=1 Tax=Malus sylvestris TaxID=3752 RepID=UPI0021AC0009|nr:rust resistance kinase Lr10-like [Malus sylvestris]
MESGRALSARFVVMAFLAIGLLGETSNAKASSCPPSSCGNIQNISYPFRLNDDPKNCGHSKLNLYCEDNVTVLRLNSGRYYVKSINYNNNTIRVVDPGFDRKNCSSVPLYSLSSDSIIFGSPYRVYSYDIHYGIVWISRAITFLNCASPVNSSLYVETAPCINFSRSGSITLSQLTTYSYVAVGPTIASDLEEGCSIGWTAMASWTENHRNATSYCYIHNALVYGFELQYSLLSLDPYRFREVQIWKILAMIGGLVMGKLMFGAPCVIWLLIWKWRRRNLSMYSAIEDFLQGDTSIIPIRYSYSDIKKMTNRFKNKLGEGGYGCVFKGNLRSGRFGAIKMLGKSKANGQDFVNEVATIGRIHHVNVVQLVGYCVEGSNRCLVYDFMPNGSLDKYVYLKEGTTYLSYEKMYQISLGVARGIEYLHQGCDMQILHFDIKPHNILLDENFNPKISDFGLAKLYPTDNSIISLTAARGTMGYMAPELFYKNIGGVSYKADVYSFGMLLMEMASRRKNLNALAEHSSQLYLPTWVYDRYNEGKDLEMSNATEEEKKIVKKMVIMALWCIQMKPGDRPSMNKVIEMLEGDAECLQMPPKPFLFPQETPIGDPQNNPNLTCSNTKLTWTLSGR